MSLDRDDQGEKRRRFRGRTVVVTGASSGVGEASARRFAREGANVVLAARGRSALSEIAAEIGERALAVPTDVTDARAAADLLHTAVGAFGDLHVLVNSAGVNRRGPLERMDPADLDAIVETNLSAPIRLCRLALPYLRRVGRGAIVNVASIAGMIEIPGEATYSATKFGLRAFSFALAEEMRGSGISVSVISPGPIETGFILDDLDGVPDIVFSQPMSRADDVAALVVDAAARGVREHAIPRSSAVMASLGHRFPWLARGVRKILARRGARVKARYRDRMGG